MVRYMYKLRKDKFVTEDGEKYKAYGIDVYIEGKKVRSIKDVSLNKKRIKNFIKQCNDTEPQYISDEVIAFVDGEFETKSRTS